MRIFLSMLYSYIPKYKNAKECEDYGLFFFSNLSKSRIQILPECISFEFSLKNKVMKLENF